MKPRIWWLISIFLVVMFLFSACSGQQIQPTPTPTDTIMPSSTNTAQPINTSQPILTSTLAPTSETNLHAKNSIPSELLISQSDVKNNKLIAFADGDYEKYDDNHRDIFVMDFDGANVKNLTNDPADDWGPVWSPDGTKILFFSDRNHLCTGEKCEFELFMMNSDGTETKKIFQSLFASIGLSWSPNLTHMTLVQEFWDTRPLIVGCCRRKDYYGDALSDIFLANINGLDAKNVTGKLQPGGFYDVTWSPDGKHFAFVSIYTFDETLPGVGDWTENLYLANANGTNLKRLPGGPFQGGVISSKAWSPDGKKLAFLTAKGIAIINADGSGLSEYSFEQNPGSREVFWLDTKHLVFTDSRGNFHKIKTDFTEVENLKFNSANEKLVYIFKISNVQTIYFSEINDDEIWQVASPWSRLADFLVMYPKQKILSPDGRWIAYITNDTDHQIRVISTETYEDYFVFERAGNDFGWSPDSKQLVFTKETNDEATRSAYQGLFAIYLDGTGFHQIGDKNLGEVWRPAIQP